MFSVSDISKEAISERAQSTIEAAFALPVLMILLLLLIQPSIILYDRLVMSGAASEGCRLLTTSSGSDVNEDYIRRRLSAIPEIDQFHIHSTGCSYEIEFSGTESSSNVSVTIKNKIKPLPLLDVGFSLTNLVDGAGALNIEVSASAQCQPEWIASSAEGSNPSGWVSV